jgi:hypothetical protein
VRHHAAGDEIALIGLETLRDEQCPRCTYRGADRSRPRHRQLLLRIRDDCVGLRTGDLCDSSRGGHLRLQGLRERPMCLCLKLIPYARNLPEGPSSN